MFPDSTDYKYFTWNLSAVFNLQF